MTIRTKTMKRNLISCLLLSCFVYCFRPACPFVFQSTVGPQCRHHCERNVGIISSGSILLAQNNPENKNERPEKDDEEDNDPMEEYLAMEEASRRVTNRLMMPRMIMTYIGETIRYLAYAFLIFTFSLNLAGYALINDGDSYRIGTLEERAFQKEISKSMKEK